MCTWLCIEFLYVCMWLRKSRSVETAMTLYDRRIEFQQQCQIICYFMVLNSKFFFILPAPSAWLPPSSLFSSPPPHFRSVSSALFENWICLLVCLPFSHCSTNKAKMGHLLYVAGSSYCIECWGRNLGWLKLLHSRGGKVWERLFLFIFLSVEFGFQK